MPPKRIKKSKSPKARRANTAGRKRRSKSGGRFRGGEGRYRASLIQRARDLMSATTTPAPKTCSADPLKTPQDFADKLAKWLARDGAPVENDRQTQIHIGRAVFDCDFTHHQLALDTIKGAIILHKFNHQKT